MAEVLHVNPSTISREIRRNKRSRVFEMIPKNGTLFCIINVGNGKS